MSEFLPAEVRAGLEAARRRDQKRRARMRVRVGEQSFTVLRYWETGFALDPEDAPGLRGLVDLYDGARHMGQCLIVATGEEGGEAVFEFKRRTAPRDGVPLDFAPEREAPAGYLPG